MRTPSSTTALVFLTFLLPSLTSALPLPEDFESPSASYPHSITDDSLPPPFHFPHHLTTRQMSMNERLELEQEKRLARSRIFKGKRQDDTVGGKLGQISGQLGHAIPVDTIPTSLAASVPISLPSAPDETGSTSPNHTVVKNPKVILNPKAGGRPATRFIRSRRMSDSDKAQYEAEAGSDAKAAGSEAVVIGKEAGTEAEKLGKEGWAETKKEAPGAWAKIKEWSGDAYDESKKGVKEVEAAISKHQNQRRSRRPLASSPTPTSDAIFSRSTVAAKVVQTVPPNPKAHGSSSDGGVFTVSTYVAKLGPHPSTTHPGEPKQTVAALLPRWFRPSKE